MMANAAMLESDYRYQRPLHDGVLVVVVVGVGELCRIDATGVYQFQQEINQRGCHLPKPDLPRSSMPQALIPSASLTKKLGELPV